MRLFKTIRPCRALTALLLVVTMMRPAFAEEGGILALLPEAAMSSHSISLGGGTLSYLAEAGTLPLRDGKGAMTAKVFYVAYSLPNSAV